MIAFMFPNHSFDPRRLSSGDNSQPSQPGVKYLVNIGLYSHAIKNDESCNHFVDCLNQMKSLRRITINYSGKTSKIEKEKHIIYYDSWIQRLKNAVLNIKIGF